MPLPLCFLLTCLLFSAHLVLSCKFPLTFHLRASDFELDLAFSISTGPRSRCACRPQCSAKYAIRTRHVPVTSIIILPVILYSHGLTRPASCEVGAVRRVSSSSVLPPVFVSFVAFTQLHAPSDSFWINHQSSATIFPSSKWSAKCCSLGILFFPICSPPAATRISIPHVCTCHELFLTRSPWLRWSPSRHEPVHSVPSPSSSVAFREPQRCRTPRQPTTTKEHTNIHAHSSTNQPTSRKQQTNTSHSTDKPTNQQTTNT